MRDKNHRPRTTYALKDRAIDAADALADDDISSFHDALEVLVDHAEESQR